MRPKNQNRRLAQIAFFGILLLAGTALILTALNKNIQYYYHPSEVLADAFVPESETFKIGGNVLPGSLVSNDDLTYRFSLIDLVEGDYLIQGNPTEIKVIYTGLLPDLFGEGKSAVVTGTLQEDNIFLADEVLARHDENYEPVKAKK